MEEITPAESLIDETYRILSEKGRLYTALSGFLPREQQIELASSVAKAIIEQTLLVAEAGTGTGKTFAYLIPILVGKKKALISTATKTLQDQLFQKDLPALINALGLSTQVQNLKGRANYICRHRLDIHVEEGRFSSQQVANEINFVREKLPQFTHGERSELPEIADDSAVWPYVTSTSDNCLGIECEFHKTCFLVKARKRALEADIVVINHHLFFADSRLKEDGFGELLPGVEIVVFDEAHQLVDIAANFYGERLSTRQFREWMEDTIREWPILDLACKPLKKLEMQLNQFLDDLVLAIQTSEDKIAWEMVRQNQFFNQALDHLFAIKEELINCFEDVSLREEQGLARCKMRLESLFQLLDSFAEPSSHQIKWIERFKNNLVLHSTPFSVADMFQLQIQRNKGAYIFTSATLSLSGSFECYINALGLKKADTLLLLSPFDFKNQALLYLPRSLPDPKQADYYDALLERVLPIINACGGRCFFLFTSHRALRQVALLLQNKIDFPILVQGEEAKVILLTRFREMGNAILLGTSTFWEGVDVKGEALSCVIIDKIPFASPQDPVIRGKMNYFRQQGLSGFDELLLPNAVLALKQGVGRLIRDDKDKGILMLADPRITGRQYGKQILESLPPMQKTREEQTALMFIEEMALTE